MYNGKCYQLWCKGKEINMLDLYVSFYGPPIICAILLMVFFVWYLRKK